jgi:hypothetical protein
MTTKAELLERISFWIVRHLSTLVDQDQTFRSRPILSRPLRPSMLLLSGN